MRRLGRYFFSSLTLFTLACGTENQSAGTIAVAITGEEAATAGFVFNEAPAMDEVVFRDGWTVKFDRWFVSLASVTLNQPGPDPAQQQKVGALVAEKKGPWLIDLTKPKSQDGTPLFNFDKGTDGKGLDSKVRYALSYVLAPPQGMPQQVNIAATDGALVAEMVQKGYTQYVEGTATRAPDMSADFKDYPTNVRFRFGWGGTVSMINCSNPDNGADEEKNRGVAPKLEGAARADLTMHLEHPFWDKLNVENPSVRFDAIAARATSAAMGQPAQVTLDDLAQSQIIGLTDRNSKPVKDRCAVKDCTPEMGTLTYDSNGVAATNLKQFMIYSAQSMAHLNGEGLCYIERK